MVQRSRRAAPLITKQLITCPVGAWMPQMGGGGQPGVSAEHQTQSGFRWLATLSALSAEGSRNHYSCLSVPAEKMSFRNLRGDSGGECSVLGRGGVGAHLAEAVILRRSRLSEGAPLQTQV